MKKFLIRSLLFASIGIVPVVALYTYFDPFKVLYDYDAFLEPEIQYTVGLNMGLVSTRTFKNNNGTYRYDSFIMGSSRSCFFHVDDWKQYLDENASCFHFHAGQESLWALGKKLEYIDESGNDINNLLLIFDHELLIQEDNGNENHLRVVPPELVGHWNTLYFHGVNFKTFCSKEFMRAYLDYKFTGEVKEYMTKRGMIQDKPRVYDSKTNELRFDQTEKLIESGGFYTPEHMNVFYERDTTKQRFAPQCLFEQQKEILQTIRSITDRHQTNVTIVISPLYDQKKLHQADREYLEELFGSDRVFDFSGINSTTNNYRNYYENSHFRPHVTREILRKIYSR